MKKIVLCLMVILLVVPLCLAGGQNGRVLVNGNPPLTQDMVDQVTEFLEWALALRFSDEGREHVRNMMVTSWRRHDAGEIKGTMQILDARNTIAQLPELEQAVVRETLVPEILQSWSVARDADSQWMLRAYNQAHPVIANGNPPLRKTMSDAFLNLYIFMVSQAAQKRIEITTDDQEQFAQMLAQQYPQLNNDGRNTISGAPLLWAKLLLAWSKAGDDEREQARASWRQTFGIQAPEEVAQQQPAPRSRGSRQQPRTQTARPQQQLCNGKTSKQLDPWNPADAKCFEAFAKKDMQKYLTPQQLDRWLFNKPAGEGCESLLGCK